MPKTTKKQFNYFCRRFQYWMRKLNISGWEIYYKHEDIGDNIAIIERHYVLRFATLYFNNRWDDVMDSPTKEVLNKFACEEAIHLLLTPLQYFSTIGKKTKEDIILSEEHAVVNSIMEAVLDADV